MTATTTEAPAQEHIEIIQRRGLGVVAMSAGAVVAGLGLRHLGSMIGDDTGAMVGIFVASIGLIFFFPAVQSYLLARRKV